MKAQTFIQRKPYLIAFLTLNFMTCSSISYAQKDLNRMTYDVTASQSSLNGRDVQEINLGLNWFLQDWLIWRNSAFQRRGEEIETVYGLDSSMRLQTDITNEDRSLGIRLFGGPGLRLASSRASAYFAEAGIGLRLGGLLLSVGGRSMRYFSTQKDRTGQRLPQDENQVFVTLSGGGVVNF